MERSQPSYAGWLRGRNVEARRGPRRAQPSDTGELSTPACSARLHGRGMRGSTAQIHQEYSTLFDHFPHPTTQSQQICCQKTRNRKNGNKQLPPAQPQTAVSLGLPARAAAIQPQTSKQPHACRAPALRATLQWETQPGSVLAATQHTRNTKRSHLASALPAHPQRVLSKAGRRGGLRPGACRQDGVQKAQLHGGKASHQQISFAGMEKIF